MESSKNSFEGARSSPGPVEAQEDSELAFSAGKGEENDVATEAKQRVDPQRKGPAASPHQSHAVCFGSLAGKTGRERTRNVAWRYQVKRPRLNAARTMRTSAAGDSYLPEAPR